MSIWIRAFCVHDTAPLLECAWLEQALEPLDWQSAAESCNLGPEDGLAAREQLALERLSEDVVTLRYREGEFAPLRIERWSGSRARSELDEVGEMLLPGAPARIVSILGAARDVVGLSLQVSDASAMGWPIGFHLAMSIAEAEDGVVDADDEWWDARIWRRLALPGD